MNLIDTLNFMTKNAKGFRAEGREFMARNQHMHGLKLDAIMALTDAEIDAVLAMFINYCADAVDYALYARDLQAPVEPIRPAAPQSFTTIKQCGVCGTPIGISGNCLICASRAVKCEICQREIINGERKGLFRHWPSDCRQDQRREMRDMPIRYCGRPKD